MHKGIVQDLAAVADSEKAVFLQRFFKTGPGEYAEGDVMLGVTVPQQRKVALRYYKAMSLADVVDLLQSEVHEHRLTALFMLVYKFEKMKDAALQQEIFELYLANTKYVNNWDLVDSSAPKIVGAHLLSTGESRELLYRLAQSRDLWERRIAMLATYAFIQKGDFADALKIAEILVEDEHDLIHKAVGWMLREIGKRDLVAEEGFLKRHYKKMPRTMLRYAIERFEKGKKDFYMGR